MLPTLRDASLRDAPQGEASVFKPALDHPALITHALDDFHNDCQHDDGGSRKGSKGNAVTTPRLPPQL
jgi:hypothetical protein